MIDGALGDTLLEQLAETEVVIDSTESVVIVSAGGEGGIVLFDQQTPGHVSHQAAEMILVERDVTELLALGQPGRQGPPGIGALTHIRPAVYTQAFVEGQVVYLDGSNAYPVNNAMPQAVFNLLAIVSVAGAAGVTQDVLLGGRLQSNTLSLLAGRVFLGDAGFPVSVDTGTALYVPLGYTPGGNEMYFSPSDRFFR